MDVTRLKEHLEEGLYAQVEQALSGVEELQVIAAHDGTWLPRSRLDEEIEKRRELGRQLEEAKGRLADMEPLRGQIEELVRDMEDRDRTIAALRRSGMIREALNRAHARDAEIVEKLLDAEAVGADGTGLAGQIAALKERCSYLFESTEEPASQGGYSGGRTPAASGPARHQDVNAAIRTAAGRM